MKTGRIKSDPTRYPIRIGSDTDRKILSDPDSDTDTDSYFQKYSDPDPDTDSLLEKNPDPDTDTGLVDFIGYGFG